MKIAIQGELGAFSHEVCKRHMPKARVVPCATSAEVFDALKAGRVDAAIIPIENTLAGPVVVHYDLLLDHDFHVNREYQLRIEHQLIAVPGTRLDQIREVLSHPVALDQCRRFIGAHKKMQAVGFYDTAGAAKHVMEKGERDKAAIASRVAAQVYGGEILRRNIEDDPQNFTRFFLIERKARKDPKADKCSIVFGLPNAAGVLFKVLSVFALREIDMCKIESRPVRGKPWEYVFYIDFLHKDAEASRNALQHLEEIAHFVKILGLYRRAE